MVLYIMKSIGTVTSYTENSLLQEIVLFQFDYFSHVLIRRAHVCWEELHHTHWLQLSPPQPT